MLKRKATWAGVTSLMIFLLDAKSPFPAFFLFLLHQQHLAFISIFINQVAR